MSNINFHNIDCMQFMASVPDKFYKLAIVDPPYGIGVNHNMGRRKGDKKSDYMPAVWDNKPPTPEYFKHLFRISINQIVWGANHFISLMPYDSSCWLLWDKKFSDEVTFAQFEMAWTSFVTTCKKYDKFPNGSEQRFHPTQKPVQLYRWLLQNYAKPGDNIFDSHGGSMSIAIACDMEGYDLDVCEIDKEYFDAAVKRFNTYKQQLVLF